MVSYLGNLVGAAALAALCTYAGVFSGAVPAINTVAAYKGGLPAGVAFARGVLCNWLVSGGCCASSCVRLFLIREGWGLRVVHFLGFYDRRSLAQSPNPHQQR